VVVLVVVMALLESVMLPVVIVVSLVADDVSVSLAVVVVVGSGGGAVSPMSKIRVDIEPLAENVDPSVAFVVVALPVPVWFIVVVVVVVVVLVALVEVVTFDVAFCAIAGARLNTATKSPKTSISATAIGAFFISQNVQE
jgi:hypothetical protein